jgi:hypothetical protein
MVDGTGASRDSKEEPALLWSARGGGNGHFGIVTELTFNTRAAPHNFHHGSFVPTNSVRNAPRRCWRPGSKLLLICLTRPFQAWIMNGSEVTVVVITIGSREQKGLVTFRRRLAGLTNKMTSGGPTSLRRGLDLVSWRSGSRVFQKRQRRIFEINTLGGSHLQRRQGPLSTSHLPLCERVSSILRIALARGRSSRGDRSDAQSYCASRGHKPLRKLSGPSFRRLANRLLRRRKIRAPPATKTTVQS